MDTVDDLRTRVRALVAALLETMHDPDPSTVPAAVHAKAADLVVCGTNAVDDVDSLAAPPACTPSSRKAASPSTAPASSSPRACPT
ncbi:MULTISPECIES: hypothetical protein [unclassified Streptomyces]|uniref:hypothetical protein n=1 Tax=unclassified Streptomyces TaxID=2593676 RepID=UPI003320C0B0